MDFEKTESEIVDNYRPDNLYVNKFKNHAGKYLTIVSQDQDNVPDVIDFEHPNPSRIKVKTTFTFIKSNNTITKINIKRFKYYSKKGWTSVDEEEISFSYDQFKQIISYMSLVEGLNLSDVNKRRITLADELTQSIDNETREKIKTLLLGKDGQKIIEELINSGVITSVDIVNIGYRKTQLQIFDKLLHQEGYITEYCKEHGIREGRDESAWGHFFAANNWIFGYGLDYRFLGILQDQAHISSTDAAGKEAVIADFLLGCKNFTVIVELKRSDTPIFAQDKNRSGSWTLSDQLVSSLSQILEQKASWQVQAETNATRNFDDQGKLIKQKTCDPKSILIIGSTSQFQGEDKESQIKAKTFELFRRDSRNIEILTYDELFERAKFIIDHRPATATGQG